jgi:putative transposase
MYSVRTLCELFGVNSSSFYKHLESTNNPKKVNLKKIVAMKVIEKTYRKSYGSRRMSKALQNEGFTGGRYATRTLMKEHGVVSTQRRKKRYGGASKLRAEGQNLLNREFTVNAPNEVWCGDITEILTKEGKLYLAGIIDLFSRKIIGYEIDDNMREQLPLTALEIAIKSRNLEKKLLHHSDRGSQYIGEKYTSKLKEYSFVISLNNPGKCVDNSVKERFWGSLRTEWIQGKIYQTKKEAIEDIEKYIDVYNRQRLHSTLGYKFPDEFEKQYYENLLNQSSAPKKVSTFT